MARAPSLCILAETDYRALVLMNHTAHLASASFVAARESSATFRCDIPWVRRLESDRFLDITVATGAQVVRAPTRW